MIKLIADLHSHTLVSSHAMNTVTDMAKTASEKGLFALAITDHGHKVNDGAHPWYFWMLSTLPDVLENIFVIKGIEANVINLEADTDVDPAKDTKLDYAIASIHSSFFKSLTMEEATNIWLNIAKNPKIDVIGHCEENRYKFDYDPVIKEFAHSGKIVELNANSAKVRPGNENNMKEIILACKRHGTQVTINSDAHSIYTLGDFGDIPALLSELDFPEELVVNSSVERLLNMFKEHNYDLYERMLEYNDHLAMI